MAWKGKVTDTSPNYAAGVVNVTIQFFDDATPTTILHSVVIPFESYKALAELQARVKAIGAEERKKRQSVDSLLAQIPVGAEVVI